MSVLIIALAFGWAYLFIVTACRCKAWPEPYDWRFKRS